MISAREERLPGSPTPFRKHFCFHGIILANLRNEIMSEKSFFVTLCNFLLAIPKILKDAEFWQNIHFLLNKEFIMRKIILSSLIALCGMSAASVLYADTSSLTVFVSPNDKSTVMENVKTDEVNKLVTFYQQGNWLKVGDKTTGNVGWVNQTQYQKMVNTPLAGMHSTYIYSEDVGDGKNKIVIYEDGHKLDDQKAKELYQQWQQKAEIAQKQFMQQMQVMQKQMDAMWQNVTTTVKPYIPVIVIEPASKSNSTAVSTK